MEYSNSNAGINAVASIQYPILISPQTDGAQLQALIAAGNYSQLFVLADANTAELCYPKIKDLLPQHALIRIPAGEQFKQIDTCKDIWNALSSHNADRNALMLNLGGGVIGDMGGFVASTFKRGIRFLQMPTTLLSQVDASVGGKLGVDFNNVKNIIGVFNNPVAVCIASDFLITLPEQQLINGFAEVLKHGLIADIQYWKKVKSLNPVAISDWTDVIETSVRIKKQVVESDYTETGLRKILNFGHTIGHAVESWSLQRDDEPLLHGESIAVGMICEAFLSHIYLDLHARELTEITDAVLQFFPPYDLQRADTGALLAYMRQDKKNRNADIVFSLLNHIGECRYDIAVQPQDILDALQFYSSQL